MADPLDNVNEVLEELQGAALRTTAGSYVRLDHVERLLTKRRQAAEEVKEQRLEESPPPKTFDQARQRAKRDLEKEFPSSGQAEPGRHVDAA